MIASLLPKPATSSCLEISDRIRVQPILDPHVWNDTQSLKQNIVTQHNLPSLIIKQININSRSDVDSLFQISRSCCKTQLPGMKQNNKTHLHEDMLQKDLRLSIHWCWMQVEGRPRIALRTVRIFWRIGLQIEIMNLYRIVLLPSITVLLPEALYQAYHLSVHDWKSGNPPNLSEYSRPAVFWKLSRPNMSQRQEPANPLDFRGTPSSHDLHKHVLRQKQLWYHSDFQEIPASCCSLRRKTCLRFNKEEVSQGAGQKSSGKMWKTFEWHNNTSPHHIMLSGHLVVLKRPARPTFQSKFRPLLNDHSIWFNLYISVQGPLRLPLFP